MYRVVCVFYLLFIYSGTQTSTRTGSSTGMSQSRSYSTSTQSVSQSSGRLPLSPTQNNQQFLPSPASHMRSGRENYKPQTQTAVNGNICKIGASVHKAPWVSTSVNRALGSSTSVESGISGRGSTFVSGGQTDVNSAVVCNCGDDGRLFTVRKEGHNTG